MATQKKIIQIILALFSALSFASPEILPDEKILEKLRSKLAGRDHVTARYIRRAGKMTVNVEGYVSCEADLKLFQEIFSDLPNYRNWMLRGINKKSGGASYFVQWTDIEQHTIEKDIATLFFYFNLPLFRQPLQRSFRIKPYMTNGGVTVEAEAVQLTKGPIGSVNAYMRALPAENAPNKIWIYLNAQIILKNWLLYEAMPERVLNGESGERLDTLVSNYQWEENRRENLKNSRNKRQKVVQQNG